MINGDKAFALLAAPRRRLEVPRAAIRNALKSNPGLRLGSKQAEHGRVAVRARAQARSKIAAWARALDSARPRFRKLRRNGARQPGIHINRFFSHPQGGRDGKPYHSTSYVNAPPCRLVDFASHCALSSSVWSLCL